MAIQLALKEGLLPERLAGLAIWLLQVNPIVGVIVTLLVLLLGGVPVFASIGLLGALGIFLLQGSGALVQVPLVAL